MHDVRNFRFRLDFTQYIYHINTFSGVSDHSRENSVNDKNKTKKKKRNQIELDSLKNKRAIAFSKKLLFGVFAIAALAQAWEWESGYKGGGGWVKLKLPFSGRGALHYYFKFLLVTGIRGTEEMHLIYLKFLLLAVKYSSYIS